MDYVQEAYQSADKSTRTRIAALKRSIGIAIANTEERLKSYGDRIKESEEFALFRKRYAQLQAQAYLDEAKTWYGRSKTQAKETGLQQIEAMEKQIDAAKTSIREKEGQGRLNKALIDALCQKKSYGCPEIYSSSRK